ncbi:rRNA adenine N(6)-methyltransferase [Thalictrum thalictroides]|uniref:rRNA adenine N(6)-methyltransferase n=1 Tax=Thalictrum thalictroides TaxID=46969 RepID=A0A7J6WLV8_THATH|nr:rRNA adenine N(6)-methyltransferase [Thalictrum thalictroides]
MFCRHNSTSLLRFLQQQQQIFRFLGTKPTHRRRYNHNKDDDDEEEDRRNRKAENARPEDSIYLHKSRGQHILTNPRVLEAIVRKADIKPTDTVLEIGPGTGNLTLKLLEAAEKVVAIEIDKRMIDILDNRVVKCGFEDRISVICKDALKTEFPHFDLIVANIPYGISSPLIAKIVSGVYSFRSATLLLQKEFAHRLLAKPGESEYNRLAVNVKLVADVEFIMDVSKRDFVPCPKVDSSVVRIHPKSQVPDINMKEWWAFTLTCFSKKNKTLGATFRQKKKILELFKRSQMNDEHEDNYDTQYYNDADDDEVEDDEGDCSLPLCSETEIGLFKDKIMGILKESGFEDKRPIKLCNEELMQLLSLFNQAGIHFHQAKGKWKCNTVI